MFLNNSLAKAKRQIGMIEGAVLYVTDKGRIRTKQPEKWEKVVYKIYVKEGVLYVEQEGRQIQPERSEKPKQRKRIKDIPDVQDTSNEATD